MCKEKKWTLAIWDIDRGLQSGGQAAAGTTDPLAAIRTLPSLASRDGSALLVLPNFHRFLQSTEIVQALARQIQEGKTSRTFVVVLSPIVAIPIELEKAFIVLDHDLPDRQQLEQIARGIATEKGELPDGDDLQRLIDAAAGLTRFEAESAYSLSLVRQSKLAPQTIWEIKTSMLKKSGLLTLHRGTESFSDIGGLDVLKQFCVRALRGKNHLARPKGVLLLSPPGCGKSMVCKALGNEIGRPTLVLDVGSLLGSLVGQSEERTRQALRIIDAMSPAVLFVDECEKAMSGVASSGQTDSGVSARMFGTFLSWMNDHISDVFTVMTSNDISKLPPEFARAERMDGVFYIDIPSSAEKEKIWPIHLAKYGLDLKIARPDNRDWTGAEIQSCCRLAALLDLPLKEAARNVVPVAVTAAESVERLRAWASGRCLDASRPGIYTRGAEMPTAAPRRVTRTSAN